MPLLIKVVYSYSQPFHAPYMGLSYIKTTNRTVLNISCLAYQKNELPTERLPNIFEKYILIWVE
jgi:hypothetical protein